MPTTAIKPTRKHAVKILALLDHGLTKGLEKCEDFEAARKLAASTSTSTSTSTYAYAYAYAYASAYASAYRHDLLKLIASVGVEVLVEMKSPGCKWLSLIKE